MDRQQPPAPASKAWSIHTRPDIISKYEIQDRVGSGAYSDVYRARRRSDSAVVALKEIHDYQSAFREIDALQILQHSPNVVDMHEYFWSEDEDAVLVLEFLPTDLASVIREAKRTWNGGLTIGEIKRWIVQILCAVDACHRNSIVHRDLKPSNLLISADGNLKLADFGQARILLEPGFVADDNPQRDESLLNQGGITGPLQLNTKSENVYQEGQQQQNLDQVVALGKEKYGLQFDSCDETDKESNFQDGGDASCLATCTASELDDDFLKSSYSCEGDGEENDRYGPLTSCVGTRWFRAPELLYGSTNYGSEVDLWSLGCIFAELFNLEPLFPGTSDIDQLGRIFNVLGNLNEEVWPGCSKLPDYQIISFNSIENPIGLEASLPNRSPDEIFLIKKLICFDPSSRATPMELLHDKYLNEEPLPVPISDLRVPSGNSARDEGSPGNWADYRHMDSDSDFDDDFVRPNVTTNNTGFSIQFP